MRLTWFFAFLLAPAQAAAGNRPQYGILLMAHGGSASWNREVLELQRELKAQAPTEVAFGMADSEEMQKAIDRLESSRPPKIVAVPLFVNSASEVLDQTRYVLGLREKPSEIFREALARVMRETHHGGAAHLLGAHAHRMGAMASQSQRVKARVPLIVTRALDDHPLVAQVLLERAKGLSREPVRETVIIVGHGPVDEGANRAWMKTMAKLGAAVRRGGNFKAVRVATIRDDSEIAVKARAAEALRRMVREAGEGGGRALVVPYLIARGGIEDHIVKTLQGLDYSWDARTICPHPNIIRWAAEVAALGSRRGDMRVFK